MFNLLYNAHVWLESALEDEEGQGLTEYALILALVAIAAIVVLGLLGGDITSKLQSVVDKL